MADFLVSDGQRFPDDFTLSADAQYKPTATEIAYLDGLKTIFERLAAEKDIPPELVAEITGVRSTLCGELRKYAVAFAALAAGPGREQRATEILLHAMRLEGGYLERRSRAFDIPFSVSEVYDSHKRVTDILVGTRDVHIPEEKQRLKIEVDRTATVMKAVLGSTANSSWFSRRGTANAEKLDGYLSALAGIARVGLMNLDRTQTPFASFALSGLKDEFVTREAGLVKNAYVWRLGVDALLVLLLCVGAFWAVGPGSTGLPNFLWLWAGAATGAWLSFSIRRVVLGFTDLAALEDDRLTPELRIVFVVALTTVIGLMFWTGMVGVTIGSFTTNLKPAPGSAAGTDIAAAAFLVGVLCGIAERSMASAVARRADDFAASIGKVPEAPK